MKNSIKTISQWLESVDRRLLFVCSFLFVAIFGYLDYLTGFEYSLSLFYLLPVGLAAWFIGRRSALILSVLSAITWYGSNAMAGQTYTHAFISYWNTAVWFGILVIFSYLLSGLKKTVEREEEVSIADTVTGLMTSNAFYQIASAELLRAKRYKRPYTLAIIDIDRYKQVKKHLGQAGGDLLLRTMADTLKDRLRNTDIIARLGEDEFVALLPETNHSSGSAVISKLQSQLLKTMEKQQWEVTFSIGAVTYCIYWIPLTEALQQTKKMMQSVKDKGGNTIRFDTAE
jgi:diguanylate cyclase (GGDEF)-like protein